MLGVVAVDGAASVAGEIVLNRPGVGDVDRVVVVDVVTTGDDCGTLLVMSIDDDEGIDTADEVDGELFLLVEDGVLVEELVIDA